MLKILRQEGIIQYKYVHSYTQETYNFIHILEIFICIYSARGDIDQISTNTLRYTMCCASIVYMFVYILIGAHMVPLTMVGATLHTVPFKHIDKLTQNMVYLATHQYCMSVKCSCNKIFRISIPTHMKQWLGQKAQDSRV